MRRRWRRFVEGALPPARPVDAAPVTDDPKAPLGEVSGGWGVWRNWVATVLVVAVLGTIIGVSVWAFTGDHDDTTTRTRSGPVPSAPQRADPGTAVTPAPGGSSFGGDTRDKFGRTVRTPSDTAGIVLEQSPPLVPVSARLDSAAPEGLVWERTYGVPLPYSTSDGPTTITDGLATGFAHTPAGAVMAGLQIQLRATLAPPAIRARILATQTIGSAAATAAFAAASDEITDPAAAAAPVDVQSRVAVSAVSADEVSVQYAAGPYAPNSTDPSAGGSDGQVATIAGPVTVVWSSGQWKLRLPDTGVIPDAAAPYSTVATWSAW